jgi:hypothetical protein
MRGEGLAFPLQTCYGGDIRWVDPSYIAIYHVLTNPVYAGAYAYGKSRHEVILDASGVRKKHVRRLPRSQWSVFLPDHHEGFIDWSTYEANCARIAANPHPRPHQAGGGAVREGTALLQGLAMCGRCGRKVRTHYTGRTASPGYHCPGKTIANGRGVYCLRIGAVQVDEGIERAVLSALKPLGIEAALAAAERLEAANSTKPWPNSQTVKLCGPEPSASMNAEVCSPSETICLWLGDLPPPRHATRKNCCAP